MDGDRQNTLLQRHEQFWNRQGTAPLKRVATHVPLAQRRGLPLADGTLLEEGDALEPERIDPQHFGGADPASLVRGDFITGASPPHLCWTEGVLGCPVRVVTGGPWAGVFSADWTHPERLRGDRRWLEKLDAFVAALARRAGGRYPITQPLLRGPIDMMAAALGHEPMCLALLEAPKRAEAFLARCAELFIETARRRLAHTPSFAGGYLSSYGIWAPGSVVRTQADNATLLSPAVYREQVLPHDRRIIEAFDFSLIHLHSGCLHIVDDLLQVEALKVVQVSLDYPGGPLAAEILPVLERILQEKCLIVTGPVTPAESQALEALSPPGGLCLQLDLVREAA